MDFFYAGNGEQSATHRLRIQKEAFSDLKRENPFFVKREMDVRLHD
jgi:hypothetical protein